MSSWVRRITFALAVGAVLLAASSGSSQEPAFSRSRWIAERSRTALFSGGVMPALGAVPASAFAEPTIAAEARKGRQRWVRVSRDILRPDGGPGQPETQTEPYLAIDPEKDLRLLAAYQEGRFANGGARSLTFALSSNGGRTWREGAVPGLTHASGGAFEKASDPWVAYGPGGRAYYASLLFNETSPENGIYVSTSEDGGRSWGPPVAVHKGDANNFEDKEAMTVDTYADSPFRGRIYVAWDTVGEVNQNLRVARSEDGGRSFIPPVTLNQTGANIGAFPLVGPGGVVHVIWFHATTNANGAMVASRSEDGGVTWSPQVQVSNVRQAGVPDLRTGGILPAAAVDRRTGRIYVVWQDDRFTPGTDQVVMSRSDDGGRNWTAPQRVSDGPDNAASFTAAVAVNGQGRVAVSYYSLRNDPSRHYVVDHYVAISRDGVSFGASRRTNRPSFDARFAAFTQSGFFLGDYQGLVGGKKLFHALWVGTLERSLLHKGERQSDAFASKTK